MVSLLSLLIRLIDIYMIILIISVVLTWVRLPDTNPVVRFIFGLTEPLNQRLRNLIPTTFGGLDCAPLIIFVALSLLKKLLVQWRLLVAFG